MCVWGGGERERERERGKEAIQNEPFMIWLSSQPSSPLVSMETPEMYVGAVALELPEQVTPEVLL